MNVLELRVEMLRHDINNKDLAKIINKSTRTVGEYFAKEDMPLSDAVKIADALGMSNTRKIEIFFRGVKI